ncbi:SRPBCC family protein [Nocardioides sp.]|uniref:SRPBCC family protein n=1 Tax=Nocardioides sp. TaxID=35761 RepID=UPI003784B0D1
MATGTIPLAWGCTPAEHARRYPADDRVEELVGGSGGSVLRMTRVVAVDAPPERVWRWVCQIAVAPYSYDWIDNRGRRSPQHLVPGADHVEVGQRVQVFRVTDVEPGRQWTGTTIPRVFGRTAVTYAVEPAGPGARLVCRITTGQRGPAGWAWARLLAWGDLVMMRRQLLNLKELAERG